jgi:hypothetical protein
VIGKTICTTAAGVVMRKTAGVVIGKTICTTAAGVVMRKTMPTTAAGVVIGKTICTTAAGVAANAPMKEVLLSKSGEGDVFERDNWWAVYLVYRGNHTQGLG